MISRSTLYSSPGGDTVQLDCTAKFVRQLGIEVDINTTHKQIDYDKYDLIHFFNIIRPQLILSHIKKCKKPFAISTIFVDYEEYERIARNGLSKWLFKLLSSDTIEYLKTIARRFINSEKIGSLRFITTGQKASICYVANRSAMLLPNSHNEYLRFSAKYKTIAPYIAVPNAIDSSIFSVFKKADQKYSDAIICVARIEGRKNQLSLIRALRDVHIPLYIIGQPSPNHYNYYHSCKAAAKSQVHFIDHISQEELAGIYRAAKVHAMPSWFETTGLSSLEAAAMECNIVITNKGDQREYFKDFAFYCDPADEDSIKKAVLDAYETKFNQEFKEYIFNNFTWEKTAEKTVEAYRSILDKNLINCKL
jgi:glycosyltransferase involved in cell wall biosynthesis